jgi:Spy/CpxP family protein refolding chaperone
MSRLRIAVALLALAGVGGWLLGDDPRKATDAKPDPAPKATHQLPAGWASLNLSDAQKRQIHAVQDDYGPKIAALKKQLEDLQQEERVRMYDLLTADQKERLKDLRDIKDSGTDDKKAEKKDEKKP